MLLFFMFLEANKGKPQLEVKKDEDPDGEKLTQVVAHG